MCLFITELHVTVNKIQVLGIPQQCFYGEAVSAATIKSTYIYIYV